MKHILITGGTDGIGKLLAAKLQTQGNTVTILGRDESKTKAVAEEVGCSYVIADVADGPRAIAAVAEAEGANGAIDILINNAGIWLASPLEEAASDAIAQVINVNVLGTIYYTQAVVPGMKQRGQGRIININSQAGLHARAYLSVYNASKWAITGFAKAMQEELKPAGIGVVGFYPGAMNTQFFAKAGDPKSRVQALNPELAVDALAYLCQLPMDVDIPEFGIKASPINLTSTTSIS